MPSQYWMVRFFLSQISCRNFLESFPSVEEKCQDLANNEGICLSFKACEKLRESFEGESISTLYNQLFNSTCKGFNICCSIDDSLPPYVRKLLKNLPQPPVCGKYEESHSHNIRRRDLDRNVKKSSKGICASTEECKRLSKVLGQSYVKRPDVNCTSGDVCCMLDTKYFGSSFKKCVDDSQLSIGGVPTEPGEFPWAVSLQYTRSKKWWLCMNF